MAASGLFRGVFGEKQRDEEITGVIVENPATVESTDATSRVLVFQLDSRPDLVFHQPIRPMAQEHKRGDRVRVHCRLDGADTAIVDWIERV